MTTEQFHEALEDLEFVLRSFESIIDRNSFLYASYSRVACYFLETKKDLLNYKFYKALSSSITSFRYDLTPSDIVSYNPFNWNVIVSDSVYMHKWMRSKYPKAKPANWVERHLFVCFHDLYRRDMEPLKERINVMENLVATNRREAKEAGRLMMLKGIVEGDEKLFKEGADFSVKKRKRLFTPDDGVDHCVDIIGMLKLAHYNNLDFHYESEFVPQELVDYTPIDISDDPVFLRVKEAYRTEHPEIQKVWDEMEQGEEQFQKSSREYTQVKAEATNKIAVTDQEKTPTNYLVRRLHYEFDEGQYYEPYLGHFLGQYTTLSEATTVVKTAELDVMKKYSEWYWMMPFPGVMDDEDDMKEELVRVFKERHAIAISWKNFDWQSDYFETIGLPSLKDMPEEYLRTIHEVFKISYFKVFPMYEDSKLYTIRRRPHKIFTDPSLWIDSVPYYWEGSGEPVICMNMEEAEKTVVELFQNGDAGNQEEPRIKELPWQELYEIVEYPVEKALRHVPGEFLR